MVKPRFLVVDDDPDILFLIEIMIQAWGCECFTAGTAAAAKEICAREKPEAMVIDVMMPQMDGPSLLRQMRAEGYAPRHVAFMSALPAGQLHDLATEFGASVVSKPFTADALRNSFRDVLEEQP